MTNWERAAERGEKPKGYAIIARFVYTNASLEKFDHVDKYILVPGDGLLFVGEDDNAEKPIPFKQPELVEKLGEVTNLQMVMWVDPVSGGLLMSGGTEGTSYGVNEKTPGPTRVLMVQRGKVVFAGIWGRNKVEAETTLGVLQRQRLRLG